jgi:Flp pilus assembly protein TadB
MLAIAIAASAAAAALLVRPRLPIPRPTTAASTQAVTMPPLPIVAGASAALCVLLLVPLPLGPPIAAVAAVLAARVVRRLEPASLRRRRARLEASLPHVVDLMSTCLAAGTSPSGALAQLALVVDPPMREELAAYATRLALGADPVAVWNAMSSHPQLGALGRALKRSAETGGSVADSLERLGTELRAERRAAVEARARTIEVKASMPLGVCLLPAFVLLGVVPMVAGSFSLTLFAG